MDDTVFDIIDHFHKCPVLVIGEAMLDTYYKGASDRLCREAPVPVVSITDSEDAPGGAANTAVNVISLGAKVHFLSVVGNDYEGQALLQALMDRKVPTDWILVDPNRKTLAKKRVIASGQMMLRYDQGSTHPVGVEVEALLIQRLNELYPQVKAVVISDYGYGIITPRILAALAKLQAKDPKVVVADSKNLAAYRGLGITAVKPNFYETLNLLGIKESPSTIPNRVELITARGEEILDLTGSQIAAVTLDQDGAVVFERGSCPYRTYATASPNTKAPGAGDTYVASLALALASSSNTEQAAEIAAGAAAVVVEKAGTTTCYTEELKNYFSGDAKFVDNAFVLAARLATYRRQGRTIVFTNGVFDILHRGHISYLNQAKALGDVLIIGLNSDASVRRLKGKERPINTLEDRGQVLAALSSVDHIISFEGDTPIDLIKLVRPDIYVKGGDYTRETLPEAPVVEELGGEVVLLPYVQNRSTTGMIQRIRSASKPRTMSSQMSED